MPFTSNNPFFAHSGGGPGNRPGAAPPRPAPMTPLTPARPSIGRANAATPSVDPQSLNAQRFGTFNLSPDQLANPQFMAMFQNFLAQIQGGRNSPLATNARGFSSRFFGSAPTQTKV